MLLATSAAASAAATNATLATRIRHRPRLLARRPPPINEGVDRGASTHDNRGSMRGGRSKGGGAATHDNICGGGALVPSPLAIATADTRPMPPDAACRVRRRRRCRARDEDPPPPTTPPSTTVVSGQCFLRWSPPPTCPCCASSTAPPVRVPAVGSERPLITTKVSFATRHPPTQSSAPRRQVCSFPSRPVCVPLQRPATSKGNMYVLQYFI